MIQIGSCDCSKTEIEMESVPPTMTTMEDTQWTDYHPIASLDSHHAPIEFVIPPQTENYTDLFSDVSLSEVSHFASWCWK